MTDIMKLAEAMAVAVVGNKDADALIEARSALQSDIETLQKEVSTLDVLLEECKMDWSGDVTQLKAEHKHEIEALQAESASLKQIADLNAQIAIDLKAERDALQSQLDAMGKGEPVGWFVDVTVHGKSVGDFQLAAREYWGDYSVCQPLYAAPKALAPLTDEQMRDAFAQALTDVYVCTRVWSAWSYGTMTEDDFSPASECDEVLDSLVQAAHGIGGTP